jgi:hypothetical protein
MDKINKYLSSLDLFGVDKKWQFLGKEKFTSKTGACLSLLLIALLLNKLINLLITIVNKESFSLTRTDTNNFGSRLNISSFQFAICVQTPQFRFSNISDYYLINAFITKSEKEFYGSDIKSGPCDSFNDNETLMNIHKVSFDDIKQKCFCVSAINNTYVQYSMSNPENVSHLIVHLNNNNKQAIPDTWFLTLYYKDYFFDFLSNETEKFIPFENIEYNYKFGTKLLFSNELGYNADAYNYLDLYNYEGTSHSQYQISERTNYTPVNDNSFTFYFTNGNKKIFYMVNLLSIDNFLAVFGGAFQLFLTFFGFIGNLYNESLLDSELLIKIKIDQSEIEKNKLYLSIKEKVHKIPNYTNASIIYKNEIQNNKWQKGQSIKVEDIDAESIRHINIKEKNENDFELFNLHETKKINNISTKIFHHLVDIENFVKLYAEFKLLKKMLFVEKQNIEMFEVISKHDLKQDNNEYFKDFPNFHESNFNKRLEFMIQSRFKIS